MIRHIERHNTPASVAARGGCGGTDVFSTPVLCSALRVRNDNSGLVAGVPVDGRSMSMAAVELFGQFAIGYEKPR